MPDNDQVDVARDFNPQFYEGWQSEYWVNLTFSTPFP